MSTTARGDELTVRDAARRVERAEETIRRWIWSGRLPARKLGNVYYVRAGDVDAAAASGVPVPRRGSTSRTGLSDWLDEVARWRADNGVGRRETAADLVLEDRSERAGRAGR